MAAWMRYRGHRPTVEMAAAMYLLFIPLWLGLTSAIGLVVLGHVLMLAGTAALMLFRSAEYARHGANHAASH